MQGIFVHPYEGHPCHFPCLTHLVRSPSQKVLETRTNEQAKNSVEASKSKNDVQAFSDGRTFFSPSKGVVMYDP